MNADRPGRRDRPLVIGDAYGMVPHQPSLPALEVEPDLSPHDLLLTLVERPEVPLVERVLHALEAHASGEQDSIATYRRMAQASDPVMALLMGLVVEDEERHHTLLERMASRLRDDLQWSHTSGALPRADPAEVDEPASVPAASARQLAHEEREGAEQLRRLAREIASLHDGFLSLLLEMMALDSEKHERVLRYLQRRLPPSR